MHRGWDIWTEPSIWFRFGRFGSFVLSFWVLIRATRFYFSLFYTSKSKAVCLVQRWWCNFKAIWMLWEEKFEEKENESFYSSIPHEQTTCPGQVKFSRLGWSLKPWEETLNLVDNLYHFQYVWHHICKSWSQIFHAYDRLLEGKKNTTSFEYSTLSQVA